MGDCSRYVGDLGDWLISRYGWFRCSRYLGDLGDGDDLGDFSRYLGYVGDVSKYLGDWGDFSRYVGVVDVGVADVDVDVGVVDISVI